eukprot:m.21937 g.21937  ORF g.21937 m.21937 type:complete len:205 (-) comp3943_c0_seq2:104-718(-)
MLRSLWAVRVPLASSSSGAAVAVPAFAPPLACAQTRGVSRKSYVRRRPNRNPRLNVTLLHSVPNLGLKGETVAVKRGFGRNYLIPQGLATYALSADDERDAMEAGSVGSTTASGADQSAVDEQTSHRVATFLSRHSLRMVRQEGNQWLVNAEMLSQKCAKQLRLDVPVERILLEQPLVTFGQHEVAVQVDDEVSSTLRVDIVPR